MTKKKPKKKKAKRKQRSIPSAAAQSTEPKPEVTPYPAAGRKVVEFEQELDRQLAGEQPEPKRGRGRPRKEVEPEPALADIIIVEQAAKIPFDLWSISQGIEELKLSDKEAALIAKPLKDLLDYYLPLIPAIAWAWISLSFVTYSTMKSRLELIAKIKKQKTPAVGEAEAQGTAGNTVISQGRPTASPTTGSQPFPSEVKPGVL